MTPPTTSAKGGKKGSLAMLFIHENPWILIIGFFAAVLGMYYPLIYLPRKKASEDMERMLSIETTQNKIREWKATVPEQSQHPAPKEVPPTELLRRSQTLVFGTIAEFPWHSNKFLLIGLVPKKEPSKAPEWIIYLHNFRASRDQLHRLVGPGGSHYATETLVFDPTNEDTVLKARVFFTFLLMKPGTDEWETWGVGDPNNAWWYLQAFQKAMGMKVTITDEKLKSGLSDTLAVDADLMSMIARGDDGSPLTGEFHAIHRPQVIEHHDEIVELSGEHPAVQVPKQKGPTLVDSSHSGATRLLPAVANDGDNTNNGSP